MHRINYDGKTCSNPKFLNEYTHNESKNGCWTGNIWYGEQPVKIDETVMFARVLNKFQANTPARSAPRQTVETGYLVETI